MRILLSILTLLFATTTLAETQQGDLAAKEQLQAKAKKKKHSNKPLLPPKEGALKPLPPVDDAPLPPPPNGFSEVDINTSTPVKPPLNLLDLHGYLRLRGDLMDGLDLNLEPKEPYPQFPSSATGTKDTLAGANIRFRLEPTINISEDVRIMAQIDMLDNLVLGSTPVGYPPSGYTPLVFMSPGQQAPVAGTNAIKDSILVKRVWGEVMTPLGLLRFGRMGSQWGLGLLENDGGPHHIDRGPLFTQRDMFSPTGHCFDCDYGSTADRIMFITKIFGHYVIPMIDFSSEGPYYNFENEWSGQPFDLDQMDDVNSYILAIANRDKPEDIRQALAEDDWILNYGIYFMFRNQAWDAVDYQNKTPETPETPETPKPGRDQHIENYAMRSAEMYVPDIWVRFMMGKLRIELEAVAVFGNIKYDVTTLTKDDGASAEESDAAVNKQGDNLDLRQFGAVIQTDYRMFNDSLLLGVEAGYASGDDSPGFGVRPFTERETGDNDINNFRFNPDYHVDMILWRQIVGTVTDAFYLKPSLQYEISPGMGTKISAVYSSAIATSSTRGNSSPLGLEFDVDFFYFSSDNFHAGLSYGLLIPLGGMNDLKKNTELSNELETIDAKVAHRLMGRLVLFF